MTLFLLHIFQILQDDTGNLFTQILSEIIVKVATNPFASKIQISTTKYTVLHVWNK